MAKSKSKNPIDNMLPELAEDQQIEPEIYNAVARCAELLGVQLIESTFNVLPSFFELGEDEGSLCLDVVDLHGKFDPESRVSTSIFQFENSKKKGRQKLFVVKDKFVVFYRIPLDCDEFHAVSFARRVGVMACYPYFRAHVAQTASLANAKMPILPTLAKMPVRKKDGRKETKL